MAKTSWTPNQLLDSTQITYDSSTITYDNSTVTYDGIVSADITPSKTTWNVVTP